MGNIDLDDDDLYLASLQILDSKKALSKMVYCYACDEEMRDGPLLICADCLTEECDLFMKNSSIISKEDAKKVQNKLSNLLNRPKWLRGIALTADYNGSWFIKINVNKITNEIKQAIPLELNNVCIEICEVGDIKAQ